MSTSFAICHPSTCFCHSWERDCTSESWSANQTTLTLISSISVLCELSQEKARWNGRISIGSRHGFVISTSVRKSRGGLLHLMKGHMIPPNTPMEPTADSPQFWSLVGFVIRL